MSFKPDPNSIYVDDREPKSLYEEFVFQTTTNDKFEQFKVVRRRLPVSDMLFRNLAAERKEIHDFKQSIQDGRLTDQLYKMSLNFDYFWLLISGSPEQIGHPAMQKAFMSKIADSETRYRGHFAARFCMNDSLLVYYFLQLCRKSKMNLRPVAGLKRPKVWIKDESLRCLHSIRGLGKKYIKALLIKFGSVVKIGLASVESIKSIHGIGDKLANHIKEVLNKEYTEKDFEEK